MAKKTITKQKMGPLGNPLGNPLGFFNSLKGKAKPELKQNLKKAQNGISMGPVKGTNTAPPLKDTKIYQGPLSERDSKVLDQTYPSTAGNAPVMKAKGNYNPRAVESYGRKMDENYLRSNAPEVQQWNSNQSYDPEMYPTTTSRTFKKGGAVKKPIMAKKVGTVKSKKK